MQQKGLFTEKFCCFLIRCMEGYFVVSFSKKDIGWLENTKCAIMLLKEFEKTEGRYN